MKDHTRALADFLYQERLTAPIRVKKHWTWRKKFAHFLDCDELNLQTALLCHPHWDAADASAVLAHREAIDFARNALGTNGKNYREVVATLETRIREQDSRDHIAFIAHLERLLHRLRHLDG